jgi:hypothetical protein
MGCENLTNEKIDFGDTLDFSNLLLENIKEKIAYFLKKYHLFFKETIILKI